MVTINPLQLPVREPAPAAARSRLTFTPEHTCEITREGQLKISVIVGLDRRVSKLLPIEIFLNGKREALPRALFEKVATAFERAGYAAAYARELFTASRQGVVPEQLPVSISLEGEVVIQGKKITPLASQNKDRGTHFVTAIKDAVAAVQQQLKASSASELGLERAGPAVVVEEEDEKEPPRLNYADLKKEVADIVTSKSRDKKLPIALLLSQVKGIDLEPIVDQALNEQNSAFLVFLQNHGAIDETGFTPLHYLCQKPESKETIKIAKKLIDASTKPILHLADSALNKTAFVCAVERGSINIVKALLKKDKTLLQKVVKYGNLPIHCLANMPRPPANRALIAAYLIKKSTPELLNTKNVYGQTALECALAKGYEDVVNALLLPLVEGLKAGQNLSENLWSMVAGYQFSTESIKLICKKLKKSKNAHLKAVYTLFCALLPECERGRMRPFEILRLSLFLERSFPQGGAPDSAKIMKDLFQTTVHPHAVPIIVAKINTLVQIQGVQNEPYKTLREVSSRYRESLTLEVLTPYEALVNAFITEYEVPKVQRAAQAVFATQENLPSGWRILKERSGISVVTGHVLGTGTFKKASTVVQYVVQAGQPLTMAREAAVYLQPLPTASDKEKRELLHEIEIIKKLENAPGIVKVFMVRASNDVDDIGILVERCNSDVEKLLQTRDFFQTMSFKKRLELFTDIAEAVASMHAKNIIHADLKPGNCLVRDGKGKITDFGTAFEKGSEVSNAPKAGFYSTPMYTSYELYVSKGNFLPNFDLFTIDLSALGDILKLLYDGKPFDYMKKLDEAATLAGLQQDLTLRRGARAITSEEYRQALQTEIVEPLRALEIKGAQRTPQEMQKYLAYSLIARAKGLYPLPQPGQAALSAQVILEASRAAVAAC